MSDSSSSENVLLIEDQGDLDLFNSEELLDAEAACMEKIPVSNLSNSTVASTTGSLSVKPTPILFGQPNRPCSRGVGDISTENVRNSFKFGQSSSLSKSVKTAVSASYSPKSISHSNIGNCENYEVNFDVNSRPNDCMKMMPASKLNMSNSSSSNESITTKPTAIVFGKTDQSSTGKTGGGFKFGKSTSKSKLAGTSTTLSNVESDVGIFTNNLLPTGSMKRNFRFNLDPRQRQNNNQNLETITSSYNNKGFGLQHMEQMRQKQFDKMNAEEENMRKIDRMIDLKKQEQEAMLESRTPHKPRNVTGEHEQVRLEKLDIERQWKELELERRTLEDQRKIQELQQSVRELQQAVKIEKGLHHGRNVKERLGQINVTRGDISERPANHVGGVGGNKVGGGVKVESRKMEERKRRFDSGVCSKFKGKYQTEKKKVRGDNRRGLPSDLVLTEVTEHGPIPAKEFNGRFLKASSLPSELILTEFGDEGPVPVEKFN